MWDFLHAIATGSLVAPKNKVKTGPPLVGTTERLKRIETTSILMLSEEMKKNRLLNHCVLSIHICKTGGRAQHDHSTGRWHPVARGVKWEDYPITTPYSLPLMSTRKIARGLYTFTRLRHTVCMHCQEWWSNTVILPTSWTWYQWDSQQEWWSNTIIPPTSFTWYQWDSLWPVYEFEGMVYIHTQSFVVLRVHMYMCIYLWLTLSSLPSINMDSFRYLVLASMCGSGQQASDSIPFIGLLMLTHTHTSHTTFAHTHHRHTHIT